jgi:TrwC relaxase
MARAVGDPMFEGRNPTTGELLGRPHGRNAVPAFDVVPRPTKSVSILYGLGDAVTARAVFPPITRGWRRRSPTWTDTGGPPRPRACVRTGVVGGGFDHRTSRGGDPLLHTHLVVGNRVQGPDGRWTALTAGNCIGIGWPPTPSTGPPAGARPAAVRWPWWARPPPARVRPPDRRWRRPCRGRGRCRLGQPAHRRAGSCGPRPGWLGPRRVSLLTCRLDRAGRCRVVLTLWPMRWRMPATLRHGGHGPAAARACRSLQPCREAWTRMRLTLARPRPTVARSESRGCVCAENAGWGAVVVCAWPPWIPLPTSQNGA